MFFRSKKRASSDDAGANPGAPASPATGMAPLTDEASLAPPPVPPLAEHVMAAEPQSSGLKQDAAQPRTVLAKKRFTALGEVIGVLMNAPGFKSMPLSDVQELVIPAVLNGQFRVGQTPMDGNGFPVPVAVVLWATVSEEVDRRLSQDQGAPLTANEWKSGSIPWLVVAAGSQRVLGQMIEHIQSSVLQGKKLKRRTKDGAGKSTIGAPTKQAGNGLAQHS